MALKLITAPAELPVTLAQAKQHLKATASTSEDSLILANIHAAATHAQGFLNRALVTQTWELSLDAFGCREIEIPKGQLQSVTSVKYIDEAGVEQTMSSSLYHVDSRSDPGRIVLDDAASWPTTDCRPNAVVILFVCGYGLAGAVPFWAHAAILLLAQYLEQRDANEKLKDAAEALMQPYRIVRF